MVELELQQIVGGVLQEEGEVFLGPAREARRGLLKELDAALPQPGQESVELLPSPEGDAEMAGIEPGCGIDLVGGEMTNDLVTEEIEGDSVLVLPGQRAPQLLDVEALGGLQVGAGDGQMEYVFGFAQW